MALNLFVIDVYL